MNIDLPFILVVAVVATGLICVIDRLFFAKKRMLVAPNGKLPILVDWSRSFFPLLVLVLVLRSFVFQPFRVPTGSLKPTIMPGDFIAVTMYSYGLRLPVIHTKIMPIGDLKRGDLALFRWPANPAMNFVKRVVGLPGDKISYIDKVFYINGIEATQTFIGDAIDDNVHGPQWPVEVYEEDLLGVKHKIYINPERPTHNFYNLEIPEGHYFMIGDNRDNSDDSRSWGVVSDESIIGKAFGVWFNWDARNKRVGWDRIWTKLK